MANAPAKSRTAKRNRRIRSYLAHAGGVAIAASLAAIADGRYLHDPAPELWRDLADVGVDVDELMDGLEREYELDNARAYQRAQQAEQALIVERARMARAQHAQMSRYQKARGDGVVAMMRHLYERPRCGQCAGHGYGLPGRPRNAHSPRCPYCRGTGVQS